ncbi:hypothetical protein GUJ93_ZPchr0002g23860 [Zizania palustris]|uniref:F-box associated beta-propeller type 3 domain-containing protein n=1 Tax=Zizania palustris TaxID=103762 RepID=A0A8J5RTB3_ZIZPA|nr:hypothetical protein GUJ93_ZPchr0002g23860 [Zizania palustris]
MYASCKTCQELKDDHFSYYTLGFHPVTKQYKVMHFLHDKKLFVGSTFSIIQVYTLGDERWRDVRCPWALNMHCVERSGVVNIDGAMYWLTKDDGSIWKHAVATFDLNVELFQWLQLPAVDLANNVLGDRDRWLITEIDGKVSVATTSYSWLTGKLQIWTLDSKIEQSWSQKYNISLPFRRVPGPHFIYAPAGTTACNASCS